MKNESLGQKSYIPGFENESRQNNTLKLAGIISDPGFLSRNTINTIRFLNENSQEHTMSDFLNFLTTPDFSPILDFAREFHSHDKRKSNGDPYLKHMLLVAYNVFSQIEDRELTNSEKKVLMGAAILHDSIEMRQDSVDFGRNEFYRALRSIKDKKGTLSLTKKEAKEMFAIIDFLTPEKKSDKPEEEKIKIKRNDFIRIMYATESQVLGYFAFIFPVTPNAIIKNAKFVLDSIRKIKIGDFAANTRETVDDVIKGYDGHLFERKKGLNGLAGRLNEYMFKFEMIEEVFANHGLFGSIMADIDFLGRYIRSKRRELST